MTMTSLLDPERAVLVVVDIQEAFRPAIDGFDDILDAAITMVRGADAIGVPVLVTEQYPRGLGDTVPELADVLGDRPRLAKTAFSAARADGFDLGDCDQVLICGIEAHVCVAQTALDLLAGGRQVQIIADAVSSRTAENRAAGLRRVEHAGATLSTVEMALFELLGAAGGDAFKTIQGLVK